MVSFGLKWTVWIQRLFLAQKIRINWSGLAEIRQNRFSVCSLHAFADTHTLSQGKVKSISLPCFREVWKLTIKLSLLHKRSHTGEKAFKCTKCDSSFSSSNDLKNYKRTHTVEKLWVHKVWHELSRIRWIEEKWDNHTGEKYFFVLKVWQEVFRVSEMTWKTWENPQLSWEDSHMREGIQVTVDSLHQLP